MTNGNLKCTNNNDSSPAPLAPVPPPLVPIPNGLAPVCSPIVPVPNGLAPVCSPIVPVPNGLVPLERKMSPSKGHGLFTLFLSFIMALTLIGCNKSATNTPNLLPAAPRTEEINIGPVEVSITINPGSVMLDRDIMLTIRATAPKNISVAIPPIADRLQGFYNGRAQVLEASDSANMLVYLAIGDGQPDVGARAA